jgi:hypothetical protein
MLKQSFSSIRHVDLYHESRYMGPIACGSTGSRLGGARGIAMGGRPAHHDTSKYSLRGSADLKE